MDVQVQLPESKKTLADIIRWDPKYFFRAAEVVAFSPEPADDSKDHVSLFRTDVARSTHPLGLVELVKVVFGVPNRGGLHSLWIVNAAEAPESKLVRLARQIRSGYMLLPAYHHATWRHVARVTGDMSAVYWNGRQSICLNAETLGIDTIHGMQGIFTHSGNLILHVFGGGQLHEVCVTPAHMEEGWVPAPHKVDEGVNCLLTMPSPEGSIMLIGRDDGLYVGDCLITATRGQRVRYLSAASEIRRVFYRANNGETWGFQFHAGCIASEPVLVDGSREAQLHFAGTTFAPGADGAKDQTLMLSTISDDPDKKVWIHQKTLVPLPPSLMAPAEIALTL